MPPDRAEKIMQLHHMGLSVKEIARKIYVAKEQVARVIEEHGERPTSSKQRRVKAARNQYEQDILTPLERRRKALMGQKLTNEKIAEVRALLEGGARKVDIVEQTGVSRASVDRIANGELTAEGKKERPAPEVRREPTIKSDPAPTFTTLKNAADTLSPRDVRILRALTEQIIRALAGTEGEQVADDHALGSALGMLNAVQMILGENGEE